MSILEHLKEVSINYNRVTNYKLKIKTDIKSTKIILMVKTN